MIVTLHIHHPGYIFGTTHVDVGEIYYATDYVMYYDDL